MKEEIQNLIDISPLDDVYKKELQDLLQSEGANKKFYDLFNKFLIEKLQQDQQLYEKVMKAYDEKLDELEKELERKREILDQEISQEINLVSEMDFQKKNQIWKQYYENVELMWREYENQIKNAFSGIFAMML